MTVRFVRRHSEKTYDMIIESIQRVLGLYENWDIAVTNC